MPSLQHKLHVRLSFQKGGITRADGRSTFQMAQSPFHITQDFTRPGTIIARCFSLTDAQDPPLFPFQGVNHFFCRFT
jgi:hypothetical protein